MRKGADSDYDKWNISVVACQKLERGPNCTS